MKPNYIDALTILIPTYNSRAQLLKLLDSFSSKDISKVHEIVILDNNSDYDIHAALSIITDKKIRIVKNAINIQMSSNIVSIYLYSKTKWVWTISDDDVILPGAIDVILKKTHENINASFFQFSTEGISNNAGYESNYKANNLIDFINYYYTDKILRNQNLVFLSSKVYNLDALFPKLSYCFEFSYTYISFLYPVFKSFENGHEAIFCEDKIIKYIHPPENSFWPRYEVALGLSTMTHIDFDIDKKNLKKLIKLMMVIPYKLFYASLIQNNTTKSKKKFDLVYNNCYRFYLNPLEKLQFSILSFPLNFPTLMKEIYSFYKK